jgi:hypothetical protein
VAKSSSALSLSQRARSVNNPIDLGVFDELTIRELTGRIGAMNTGQTALISTNDGTGNAVQNAWFKITVKVPFFIIFIKPLNQDNKYIDLGFYKLGDPRTNLALPILRDPDLPFYWGHAASMQSNIYNLIENEVTSPNIDKGYSMLKPMDPGSYLIKLSTQRWDVFRYCQYFVIETPTIQNYTLLDNPEAEEYLLLEESTVDVPVYLLDETPAIDTAEIRQVRSHSLRRWEAEWERTYTRKAFPTTLTNYVTAINTCVANPDWTIDQKSAYLKTVRP